AILDVLAGYETGDATWAPPPFEPFAAAMTKPPAEIARGVPDRAGRLRVAATLLPPIPDAVVDPACSRAVSQAADLLRSLGHEVEEVTPPWQLEGASELFGAVFSNHISLSIAFSGLVAGREPTAEDMEPMSWAIFSMIKKMDAVQGMMSAVQLQAFARQ